MRTRANCVKLVALPRLALSASLYALLGTVYAASMPQKLQTNEAARAPQSQGDTAKTPADAQARVQLMDFTSRRSPVMGTRGMVASSQPLASEVSAQSCATCYWCRHVIPKYMHNPCVCLQE